MRTSTAYRMYCFLHSLPMLAINLALTMLGTINKVNRVLNTVTYKVLVFVVWLLAAMLIFAIFSGEANAAPNADTISNIAFTFQQKASAWEPILRLYALSLFRWLLIIDVCWLGIRMALKQAEIQEVLVEFIRLVVFASFMFVLVIYYKTWANALIGGLSMIAENGLGAQPAEAAKIFGAGLDILHKSGKDLFEFSKLPGNIIMAACAIFICVIFAMIAAQMIYVKCEAYIVLNAGAILLGFGGSQFTKDYAINFMRYALAVAMKLFVMQLIATLGMEFIEDFQKIEPSFEQYGALIGCCIILLALVKGLPDVMSGIINGSHVSSGQAITSAVTAASTATIAAMTALKGSLTGGKNAVDAVKEASKFANESGASGLGKAGHMAKSLYGAAKASKKPTFGENVASNLKATREAFKMEQDADSEK